MEFAICVVPCRARCKVPDADLTNVAGTVTRFALWWAHQRLSSATFPACGKKLSPEACGGQAGLSDTGDDQVGD